MEFLGTFNQRRSDAGWKQCRRACLIALTLLFWEGSEVAARAQNSREYEIKAVFLYNFTQFITWPTNALPDAQTPLTIDVLGNDPFGAFLDETVKGEQANGRPILIRRLDRIEDLGPCQILFVSRSESRKVAQILGALRGKNVLTVSDIENFCESGGVIQFIVEQNKLHLRINPDAAQDANLVISSQLLRLAQIVRTQKE